MVITTSNCMSRVNVNNLVTTVTRAAASMWAPSVYSDQSNALEAEACSVVMSAPSDFI